MTVLVLSVSVCLLAIGFIVQALTVARLRKKVSTMQTVVSMNEDNICNLIDEVLHLNELVGVGSEIEIKDVSGIADAVYHHEDSDEEGGR